jgi:hypothetical protein
MNQDFSGMLFIPSEKFLSGDQRRLTGADVQSLGKPCLYLSGNYFGYPHSRYSDWLRAGRPRGRSSSPGRGKIFLFSTLSRPVLGPTQPLIQWVLGALSPGVKRPGCEANHSPLMPKSRKRGSIHPLPHTPSWRSA